MSVLYVLVPVALGLVTLAVIAYVWSSRSGQFDDLTTPALRALLDDTDARPRADRADRADRPADPPASR